MSKELLCEYCHRSPYNNDEVFCKECGHKLHQFTPTCKCGTEISFFTSMGCFSNIAGVYSTYPNCGKCGINTKPILKQYTRRWVQEHPINTLRKIWSQTSFIRFFIFMAIIVFGSAFAFALALGKV